MSVSKGVAEAADATRDAGELPEVADQDTFVTRLPILNRKRLFFAYQLLFRPLDIGAKRFVAPDQTSARVISDAVISIGLEALNVLVDGAIRIENEGKHQSILARAPIDFPQGDLPLNTHREVLRIVIGLEARHV